jgi:hypothetical protein
MQVGQLLSSGRVSNLVVAREHIQWLPPAAATGTGTGTTEPAPALEPAPAPARALQAEPDAMAGRGPAAGTWPEPHDGGEKVKVRAADPPLPGPLLGAR